MPSMPSMPKFDELAHREGIPGVFGVHPVFPHGGDYRLCLTILPPEIPRVRRPARRGRHLRVSAHRSRMRRRTPTPAARRVRPFQLDVTTDPRQPVAGEDVEIVALVRMASSFERREDHGLRARSTRGSCIFSSCATISPCSRMSIPSWRRPASSGFAIAFRSPGRYRVFADVAPQDAGSQILSATLRVGGEGTAPSPAPPARCPGRAAAFAWPEGGNAGLAGR